MPSARVRWRALSIPGKSLRRLSPGDNYWSAAKPVLTVRSGDLVEIQTVSGHPERLEQAGLPPDQIPPALRAVYGAVPQNQRGPGGHLLTGPVAVEGAEPGNVLEVRIRDIRMDVPFAYNALRKAPLEGDRKAVGGPAVASKLNYTFRMKAMTPLAQSAGGSIRVADFWVKPGALRELHWHPDSEWQYFIGGSGRMTVFASAGQAHTMDYNANDVGFVPAIAGHYIQNTGYNDLVFLALFKRSDFVEFSLAQCLRRLPVQMTQQHLHLSPAAIAKIPDTRNNIFPR